MEQLYYIGMDIHKRSVAFCVKDIGGNILKEGTIPSDRESILQLASGFDFSWIAAMEATMFTNWIYDLLSEEGYVVQVADPSRIEAISSAKKKNDRIDARMLSDLLRCDLLPGVNMIDRPTRELRSVLRLRNLVVGMVVKMKNRISGFLMENGVEYEPRRLHGKRYFEGLLGGLDYIPETTLELLQATHFNMKTFEVWQKRLVRGLMEHPHTAERVARLMSIRGVGEITALTWVLEMGEPGRFQSVRKAVSYCGLCSALKESAGKSRRGPLSKQRNSHIQTVLVEAAKIAPQWNPQLKAVHERELERGNRNRATLAVARKLVAYMLYVEKSGKKFVVKEETEKVLSESARRQSSLATGCAASSGS